MLNSNDAGKVEDLGEYIPGQSQMETAALEERLSEAAPPQPEPKSATDSYSNSDVKSATDSYSNSDVKSATDSYSNSDVKAESLTTVGWISDNAREAMEYAEKQRAEGKLGLSAEEDGELTPEQALRIYQQARKQKFIEESKSPDPEKDWATQNMINAALASDHGWKSKKLKAFGWIFLFGFLGVLFFLGRRKKKKIYQEEAGELLEPIPPRASDERSLNMAMTKCPECGKNISEKALACPGCGYPLQQAEITLGAEALKKKASGSIKWYRQIDFGSRQTSKRFILILLGSILITWILALLIMALTEGPPKPGQPSMAFPFLQTLCVFMAVGLIALAACLAKTLSGREITRTTAFNLMIFPPLLSSVFFSALAVLSVLAVLAFV